MTLLIADTFSGSLGRLTGDEQKAVKTTAFDLQVGRVIFQHSTSGGRVVVVRAFIKKTQAVPAREVDLALRRAQELR